VRAELSEIPRRVSTSLRLWRSRSFPGRAHLGIEARLIIVVLVSLMLAGSARLMELAPQAPSGRGPSLNQLDTAITLTERYVDGLYKPLPGGMAVQSEEYSLPIRVFFPGYKQWVLLGEGKTGQCLTGSCKGSTSIQATFSDADTERVQVSVASPANHRAVRLSVAIDWSSPRGVIIKTSGDDTDPKSSAHVYLNTVRLVVLPASGRRTASSVIIPPVATTAVFQSLRYTVRHATQEAYLYWKTRGDLPRARALSRFLLANGYRPGVDIRSALFGMSQGMPDDLPYVTSGNYDMYPDCSHLPPPSPEAYPYQSKVCLLGVKTFVAAAKFDPFTQAAQALAVLANHHNPDYKYSTGSSGLLHPAVTTPRLVARALERLYGDVGYGEPTCDPTGCHTAQASALRTFHFGVLETILGYRYHDTRSARYADAVARQALEAQVGSDGIIRTPNGDLFRPVQTGAFPIYWDRSGRFVPPAGLTQAATTRLSMPPEYAGQLPSDTETTLDGWAFVTTYRCLAKHVGCSLTGWRS
jgi:hypothetical protein